MTNENKIKNTVEQSMEEIETIDNDIIMDVVGVAQAIDHLREALNKVEICLDKRQFEKASSLGYSDISSEFIFLQRTLGGLQHSYGQKQSLVSEIALKSGVGVYEEVEPFIDKKMKSLEPRQKPMKIEVSIGKKTVEKLRSLQNIRHTPIENLAEHMIASAMKNDEQFWQEQENNKPPIPNIKHEKKDSYTSDETFDHIRALGEQEKERMKNLY